MRRWRFWLGFVFAVLLPAAGLAQRPTAPLQEFPTEQQAQDHCPRDVVVWLNLPTGIYHYRVQFWYGVTNVGAYVCLTEANRAGMRAARNGQ